MEQDWLLPPSVTVSVHLLQHVGIACYAQRCTSYSKSVCPSVTCWSSRTVPQEFKDVLIVHIFKRKGDRSVAMITVGSRCSPFQAKYLPALFSTVSPNTSVTTTSFQRVNVAFGVAVAPWTWSLQPADSYRKSVVNNSVNCMLSSSTLLRPSTLSTDQLSGRFC